MSFENASPAHRTPYQSPHRIQYQSPHNDENAQRNLIPKGKNSFQSPINRGPLAETTNTLGRQVLQSPQSPMASPGQSPESIKLENLNVKIKDFIDKKQIDKAQECLDQAIAEGLKPRAIAFTLLINAFGTSLDKAFEIYDTMQTMRVKPSAVTYGVLIKLCIKADQLPKALELYRTMQKARVVPTSITYATLIKGCVDKNDLKSAFDIDRDIINANVVLDEVIAGALINAYVQDNDIEVAKNLFRSHFTEAPKGYSVDLHGNLSLGAGFIKTLLFLENGYRDVDIKVITGQGLHNTNGEYHKMYDYVLEKLKSHFGDGIKIKESGHNPGCFKVVMPSIRTPARETVATPIYTPDQLQIFENSLPLALEASQDENWTPVTVAKRK